MGHRYRYGEKQSSSWPGIIVFLLLGLLATAGGMFFLKPETAATEHINTAKVASAQTSNKITVTDKVKSINLQPTIDKWVKKQRAVYGILVYDPANETVAATYQSEKLFFTASMYKLSVAYLALKDFQSGVQNPNEVVLAGQTRKQCVYKMIHNSDSPCGETMLKLMGATNVGKRNKTELGLSNAIFPGYQTSAADMVKILKRLYANNDLNSGNTAFLLDAMKTQVYRKGVPAGMPKATIANKIGYDAPSVSSPDLWADGGIIYLPDNRQYIYCIFGDEGVGSANIRRFAEAIYPILNP